MAKMNELMEKMRDEAFAKKFEGCKSAEDFVEVAKKEGYDITVDDIVNDLELSDEDMAKVAGGGLIELIDGLKNLHNAIL